jgi:glycosyltransferase involved in cell wall biosynthesis
MLRKDSISLPKWGIFSKEFDSLKTIHLFTNKKSQFGVLEIFSHELQKALRRAGIHSETFDILQEGIGDIIGRFKDDMPDCTIGFNMTITPDFFFDVFQIPHVAIYVDSVTYHREFLECLNIIGCFVEEDSRQFLQTLNRRNTLFFPHAIDTSYLCDKDTLQNCTRDYDVVMCATFYDPNFYLDNWNDLFSKRICALLRDLAQSVLTSTTRSPLRAFCEEVHPGDSVDKELTSLGIARFHVANSLEQYIRALERVRFVEAISNYDVHIFGVKEDQVKWKKAFPDKKRLFLHDEVAYTELPELFRRSKIVINSAPMIKHGVHERILLALSQGASVLTSDNTYIAQSFIQEKAVRGVIAPNFKNLDAVIDDMTRDEDARLDEVLKTHPIIRSEFSWDRRVAMLQERLPELIQEMQHVS